MKRDKALIEYKGVPHAIHISEILKRYCDEVFLSARSGQWSGTPLENIPVIEDREGLSGPIAGILSAMAAHPEANWMVVACDLVHFNEETIKDLLSSYDPEKSGVAFRNSEKPFAEPLCTLYTPKARELFSKAVKENITCPVKVLKNSDVVKLAQTGVVNLANINTVEEYKEVVNETH